MAQAASGETTRRAANATRDAAFERRERRGSNRDLRRDRPRRARIPLTTRDASRRSIPHGYRASRPGIPLVASSHDGAVFGRLGHDWDTPLPVEQAVVD